MSCTNDGGPAFHGPDFVSPSGEVQWGPVGMSLRDWLAGQALVTVPHVGVKAMAVLSYELADAMLAARKEVRK